MAYKTLIFGVDDLFNELQPYYACEVLRGNLEIVAFAVLENDTVTLFDAAGKRGADDFIDIDIAIISSRNDFYARMKFLEAQGIPRNRIIDGRVFQVPNLDFPRLLKEGVAYGVAAKNSFDVNSHSVYAQAYEFINNDSKFISGIKSFLQVNAAIKGNGLVIVGNFSSLASDMIFSLGQNYSHNYRNVCSTNNSNLDWKVPAEFRPPQGTCKILIGNDVWIGRGCTLKSANPNKPLVIEDGAVIASDSVVVKNVPPYAIVGGNPAKIIKFRFSEDVIEALLRIKWWDWSLDKIHDNFKYFNDIERFIALHDR